MHSLKSFPGDLEVRFEENVDGECKVVWLNSDVVKFRPGLCLADIGKSGRLKLSWKAFWVLVRYQYTDKLIYVQNKMDSEWMKYEPQVSVDTLLELLLFCVKKERISHFLMLVTERLYLMRDKMNYMKILATISPYQAINHIGSLYTRLLRGIHRAMEGRYLIDYHGHNVLFTDKNLKRSLKKQTDFIYENVIIEPSTFADDFSRILKQGPTRNFSLILKDNTKGCKKLHIHREILIQKSTYFLTCLTNANFIESKSSALNVPFGLRVTESFVLYCYSGELNVDNEILLEFIHLCDQLLITNDQRIYKLCKEALKKALNAKNCLEIHEYFQFNVCLIFPILQYIEEWIRDHWEKVVDFYGINEMPSALIEKQKKYIRSTEYYEKKLRNRALDHILKEGRIRL